MSDLISTDWPESRIAEANGLCEEFLTTEPSNRFVLGQNVYTESLIENIEIAGVIDEFATETKYPGTPLISWGELPESAIVVNAAGGSPFSAKKQLDLHRVRNIDYFALLKLTDLNLRDVVFNEGFESMFRASVEKFEWVFSLLEDKESKDVLKKILSFRFTKNLDHLTGFSNREMFQYFEEMLNFDAKPINFLDVGGFDGFTTSEFMRIYPEFGEVVVIEPEEKNYQICKEKFLGNSKVHVLKTGVGSKRQQIRFSSAGSASRVSEDGNLVVDIDTVDNLISESNFIPGYIKMDIEGFELEALAGCSRAISKYRPNLAISVYHNPNHFWQVPELILQFNSDYRVFLRHYTESIYETIMYFVPRAETI
jgi:FkbM family methyltransferase